MTVELSRWLTAAEIAAGSGLAVGSVYRLASQNRWRRTGTRPQRYAADDVLATLTSQLDSL